MAILVTGGTGYIGAHTTVELLNNGYEVIIVDNLSNSNLQVLEKIQQITNKKPIFYQVDIANKTAMTQIFKAHQIDGVIHFAGFKAVGESVLQPLKYYINNVLGSIMLFDIMNQFNVKTLIFSSSATVYGATTIMPITEDTPLSSNSPYGQTKLMIENILNDLFYADKTWNIVILRYFNPVGAHQSGLIGENPNGVPNNLMPFITQVATGKLEQLSVYGTDYPTPDGTGVRDYIHVVDLALGHLQALDYCTHHPSQLIKVNLGTGIGYSVLDVVRTFEHVTQQKIKYRLMPRRSGDVATCYASTALAQQVLNFRTKFNLADMCKDSWRFQQLNHNS